MAEKLTLKNLSDTVLTNQEYVEKKISELTDSIKALSEKISSQQQPMVNDEDLLELKSLCNKQQDKINQMNYINTKIVKQITDIATQLNTNTNEIIEIKKQLSELSNIPSPSYGESITTLENSQHSIDSSVNVILDRMNHSDEKINTLEAALNVIADKTLVNIRTTKSLNEELQQIKNSGLQINRMDVLDNLVDDIKLIISKNKKS